MFVRIYFVVDVDGVCWEMTVLVLYGVGGTNGKLENRILWNHLNLNIMSLFCF